MHSSTRSIPGPPGRRRIVPYFIEQPRSSPSIVVTNTPQSWPSGWPPGSGLKAINSKTAKLTTKAPNRERRSVGNRRLAGAVWGGKTGATSRDRGWALGAGQPTHHTAEPEKCVTLPQQVSRCSTDTIQPSRGPSRIRGMCWNSRNFAQGFGGEGRKNGCPWRKELLFFLCIQDRQSRTHRGASELRHICHPISQSPAPLGSIRHLRVGGWVECVRLVAPGVCGN